jgi:hypothetical protein
MDKNIVLDLAGNKIKCEKEVKLLGVTIDFQATQERQNYSSPGDSYHPLMMLKNSHMLLSEKAEEHVVKIEKEYCKENCIDRSVIELI